MIYSICGTDPSWVQKKKKEIISVLVSKRPNSPVEHITKEDELTRLLTLIDSKGLFDEKSIVVVDFKEHESSVEVLLDSFIDDGKESDHAIIIVYTGVKKGYKEKLEKLSQKQWCEESVTLKAQKKDTELFDFTDALCGKSPASAWLIYNSSLKNTEFELIFGTIVWGFKTLALCKSNISAKESGVHPFVHRKYNEFGKKWKEGEVAQRLVSLLSCISKSREKRFDEYSALEKWILENT